MLSAKQSWWHGDESDYQPLRHHANIDYHMDLPYDNRFDASLGTTHFINIVLIKLLSQGAATYVFFLPPLCRAISAPRGIK